DSSGPVDVPIKVVKVMALPRQSPIRYANLKRVLQAEGQQGFRGNRERTSTGNHLSSGTGRRARDCPDRRAFSSAGNGPDDPSQKCSTSDVFAGTPVGANSVLRFYWLALRVNAISLAID